MCFVDRQLSAVAATGQPKRERQNQPDAEGRRTTASQRLRSSEAGRQVHGPGHDAVTGLPVVVPAATTLVRGEAAIEAVWPPLALTTPEAIQIDSVFNLLGICSTRNAISARTVGD